MPLEDVAQRKPGLQQVGQAVELLRRALRRELRLVVLRIEADQVTQRIDRGLVEAAVMQARQHVQPRQVEAAYHRFSHIGHRHQLGQWRDLVVAHAVRIAAAVQALVVVQHCLASGGREARDAVQQHVAGQGMDVYIAPLFGRNVVLAGQQHRVGVHFADVMAERGRQQDGALAGGQFQALRQCIGDDRGAQRVLEHGRPLRPHHGQAQPYRLGELQACQALLDGHQITAALGQPAVQLVVVEDLAGRNGQAGSIQRALAGQRPVQRDGQAVLGQAGKLLLADLAALGHQLDAVAAKDILLRHHGLFARKRRHRLQIKRSFADDSLAGCGKFGRFGWHNTFPATRVLSERAGRIAAQHKTDLDPIYGKTVRLCRPCFTIELLLSQRCRRHFHPFAWHQRVAGQRNAADGAAHQSQRRQADRGRHAPHLAVLAFLQGDGQPAGRLLGALAYRRIARPQPWRLGNLYRMAGLGGEIAQVDRCLQPRQAGRVRHAVHLHQIGFRLLVVGMGDVVLQLAVVGQQQQAFAVGVEAAGRVDVGDLQVVGQGGATGLGRELAQHLEGLVEQD